MGANREQLRAERKLRLIDAKEESSNLEFLPGGIYGYSYSPHTDGLPIWARQVLLTFEVHKLNDGSVHFIGYLTDADASAYASSREAIDIRLYPEPYEQAQKLVSIPREEIIKMKPVSREHGNWLPLTVVPK